MAIVARHVVQGGLSPAWKWRQVSRGRTSAFECDMAVSGDWKKKLFLCVAVLYDRGGSVEIRAVSVGRVRVCVTRAWPWWEFVVREKPCVMVSGVSLLAAVAALSCASWSANGPTGAFAYEIRGYFNAYTYGTHTCTHG